MIMQLNEFDKYIFNDLTKRKSKKILRKESVTSLEQLSESWFLDHHNWRKKFAGLFSTEQLELKLRWYTEIGKICKSAIIDQIFDSSSPIKIGRRRLLVASSCEGAGHLDVMCKRYPVSYLKSITE